MVESAVAICSAVTAPDAIAAQLALAGQRLRAGRYARIAAEAALPNARKKDSTGICFIGERPFREFLQRYVDSEPGPIVDDRGRAVTGRPLVGGAGQVAAAGEQDEDEREGCGAEQGGHGCGLPGQRSAAVYPGDRGATVRGARMCAWTPSTSRC